MRVGNGSLGIGSFRVTDKSREVCTFKKVSRARGRVLALDLSEFSVSVLGPLLNPSLKVENTTANGIRVASPVGSVKLLTSVLVSSAFITSRPLKIIGIKDI